MTNNYWIGQAEATKQVQTTQITAAPATSTFTITIGGIAVTVDRESSVNATAASLQAACAAKGHPYFRAIAFTVATDTITLTARIAGVPFVYSTSTTNLGTVSDATTTAGTGPNYASDGDNWSTGSVPAASEDVIFADNSVDVCWGLDLSAVSLGEFRVESSYTGRIGLDYLRFATSINARVYDGSSVREYRDTAIELDMLNGFVNIGKITNQNDAGSDRIVLYCSAPPDRINLWSTAQTSAELKRPSVRIITASTSLVVYNATSGVGISDETPTDAASALNSLIMIPENQSSWVIVGDTSTVGEIQQRGGSVEIKDNASLATINLYDGELKIDGTAKTTTVNQYGGTFIPLNIVAGDQEVDNFNYYGGILDLSQRYSAFEYDDFYFNNLKSDGQIIAKEGIFTYNTAIHWVGKVNFTNRRL